MSVEGVAVVPGDPRFDPGQGRIVEVALAAVGIDVTQPVPEA